MVSSVAVSRAVQVQAVMSVQWGAVRCATEVRGWRGGEWRHAEVPAAYLTRSSRPAALFPERPAPRYEVRHRVSTALPTLGVLLSDDKSDQTCATNVNGFTPHLRLTNSQDYFCFFKLRYLDICSIYEVCFRRVRCKYRVSRVEGCWLIRKWAAQPGQCLGGPQHHPVLTQVPVLPSADCSDCLLTLVL